MYNIYSLWTNQYIILLSFLVFGLILGFIIILLSYFIAVQNPDSEKVSAYECGFEPFEDARNRFDVRFYIVAILFLIFDIEILYLFPWVVSLNVIGFEGFWIMIIFLILLTIGFVYEIFKGALDWE